MDRRNFLVTSGAGLVASGLTQDRIMPARIPLGQKPVQNFEFTVGFDPGMLALYDDQHRLISATPSIIVPTSVSDELARSFAEGRMVAPTEDVLMLGMPNFLDFLGAAVPYIQNGGQIELGLNYGIKESLLGFEQPPEALLRLAEQVRASQLPGDLNPQLQIVTPSVFGWRFIFRGPETGRFGWCDNRDIRHFNAELHYQTGNNPTNKVVNFHLGSYRQGSQLCFALWENKRFFWCWKSCTPTYSQIKSWMKAVITAAAAAVGIALAAWAVEVIATAAAGAIFALLLI